MRTYDFAPLYRSTVGFDRMFSILDQLGGGEGSVPSYPPYNIERNGENAFRISVAVAGFTDADLSIEAKENTLTIRGEKQTDDEEPSGEVLYKGIAEVYEAMDIGFAADVWGDVPYADAVGANPTPAFEPQMQVYTDLLALLDGHDSGVLKRSGAQFEQEFGGVLPVDTSTLIEGITELFGEDTIGNAQGGLAEAVFDVEVRTLRRQQLNNIVQSLHGRAVQGSPAELSDGIHFSAPLDEELHRLDGGCPFFGPSYPQRLRAGDGRRRAPTMIRRQRAFVSSGGA